MNRVLIGIGLSLALISNVNAEGLSEKGVYRTKVNLKVSTDGATYNQQVGSQSKFYLVKEYDDKYAIQFLNIYNISSLIPDTKLIGIFNLEHKDANVIKDELYFIKKNGVGDVPLESNVERATDGIVSGPLIVPFKYRLDDKTLSGSATIGYYAGYAFDVAIKGNRSHPTLTPFLSTGLTQIAISATNDDGTTKEENHSGVSVATGLLMNNWDNINIGLVVGQDRIGDQDWVHEGKTWVSVSIGWNLTGNDKKGK